VSDDLIRQYMAQDQLARILGIELVSVGSGSAVTRMTIDTRHMNGAGVVHGGTIFSLADIAFAAASNSAGTLALALDVTINFVKAVKSGALTARATETTCKGHIGLYDIRVEDQDGDLVALFHGTAYRKKTPIAELIAGGGQH
jgi:acyl-CoA thioesterase